MRSRPVLPVLPLFVCLACSGSDSGSAAPPTPALQSPAPEGASPVVPTTAAEPTPLRQQVVLAVTGMS